jgi:signal transduction histidine kinase
MTDKWRPRLGLVVLIILMTVMVLPLVGLFFFRLYENQLIRQTEAELIAQGAAVAAIYAREISDAGIPPEKLGARLVPAAAGDANELYHPIEPSLDLATDSVLPQRPDPSVAVPDPTFTPIGARLSRILVDTQMTTLAGFRLLDPAGTVIAGSGEMGKSFAAIEEVQRALTGRYSSALRTRILDSPTPPIYSISRGTRVRVFAAIPVIVGNQVAGVVYVSRTPSNIVKHLYGERGKVMLAAITIIGVTLMIAFVFMRTISRPIHELIDRTARISAGDRTAIGPLHHNGTREMAELSRAFLDMADKLQIRSDTIRTFATHVSHELKSPLTAIQGATELLRDAGEEMEPEKRARFYGNIIADTDRLNRLVRRLIELAKAESAPLTGETTSLAEVLDMLNTHQDMAIRIDAGLDLRFRMSTETASIVLTNLADNSARHGATRFSLCSVAESDSITITASDNGTGISPGNRGRIFEPFFTTRRETGGTGLGLGIAAALTKAHHGTIELGNSATGTRFIIKLPAV